MRVPLLLATMLLSPFLTWFLMLVPAVAVALVSRWYRYYPRRDIFESTVYWTNEPDHGKA